MIPRKAKNLAYQHLPAEFQANLEEHVIARWTVPVGRWKKVHHALVKEDMRSGLRAGLTAGGLLTMALLLYTTWLPAVLTGLLVGIVFGLLAHFLRRRLHVMSLGRQYVDRESVDVELRASGMVINGDRRGSCSGEKRPHQLRARL